MTSRHRNSPPTIEALPGVQDLVEALGGNLCILDTETTGFQKNAGIVELAYLWIGLDGRTEAYSCLLNPEEPIPYRSSVVHGIYDRDVANASTFEAVAPGVAFIFQNAVVSGFNVRSYDIGVLTNAGSRYGHPLDEPSALDVRDVWRGVQGTTKGNLAAVADHYQVQPGPAHQGMGDVITTARILEAMTRKHGIDPILSHFRPTAQSRQVQREVFQ